MIKLGYADLMKAIKMQFFQETSGVVNINEIKKMAIEKFNFLIQYSEDLQNSNEKCISTFLNPIFICLQDYPDLFLVIINDFHKLPNLAQKKIISKFEAIMKHTIQKDEDNSGYHFKQLYSRHVLQKRQGDQELVYWQLIEIFFASLKKEFKHNPDSKTLQKVKNSVLNEATKIVEENLDIDILIHVTAFLDINELIEYLITNAVYSLCEKYDAIKDSYS